VPKPVIPPTKLELSESAKIYDIIFPGFQAVDDAICYENQHIKGLKSVRYSKYIPW
jgi:hypothetical protein